MTNTTLLEFLRLYQVNIIYALWIYMLHIQKVTSCLIMFIYLSVFGLCRCVWFNFFLGY